MPKRTLTLPGGHIPCLAMLLPPANRLSALRLWPGLLVLVLLAPAVLRADDAITSVPFAPRSGPRGPTLFTSLPPALTGIRQANAYADPRMWNEYYHELEIGSIGSGVAIGDLDNDGLPDLFIASKVESARLYHNLGGFRFEDVTEQAGVLDNPAANTGAWKAGAAMADVNNDGWLDLYVCRFNAPNLLYLNQHDGTFRESAGAAKLDVTDASNMAAFCDYDCDGWLDLYLQTNLLNTAKSPRGQKDRLFHNNRDGTFTEVTRAAGLSETETQGHSAVWWDYDEDGWPDLYVANDFETPDFLYHNNRDGTFTNVVDRVVPHTPFSSMGADLGDVDGDGHLDFIVADMAATHPAKDQRGMADARAGMTDPADGTIAVPGYQRNALYLNTGTGRMLEAATLTGLAATDWTWSVRFEDLDNDGRPDLHVTNGMYREIHNADLLHRMMTAESPQERVRLVRTSPVLAETNLAFRNLGGLRFESTGAAWGLDQKGVSFGAAFGDLDGDGDLDLVFTNYQAGPTVLRNDSAEGHRVTLALRGTASNRFGVGATVRLTSASGRQVRQLSLARGYLSTSEPVLHFGLGPDERIERLEIDWPGGHRQVWENLPGDRRYTLTEPAGPATLLRSDPPVRATLFHEQSLGANLNLTAREEPIDEISLQRFLPQRFNRRGPALAVGDVNGDQRPDLLLGGTTRDPAQLLLAGADGHFTAVPIPSDEAGAAVNDGPILIFDANGDGRNDLLLTKGGNSLPAGSPAYQPRLFLSATDGFTQAGSSELPALPFSVGAVAAADFDHDGHVDLFLGARLLPGQYPETPRSALLANHGGRFTDVTDSLAPALREPGLVTAALWSDTDGDGWPDLVLALDWGQVKLFHNQQGRGFEDWTERSGFASAGTGWWLSLASADFNGDGRPDFAVGNTGLNTPYQADARHPALLYSGQFKDDAEPQIVEARYDGDRLIPWRSRKELAKAMPSILQRFPRNDLYAGASLGQILGEDRLAAAHRFAATELRSGVLLSQPDGTYRFQALPLLAQIAPLAGMVTGDFDGDGHADLYVVQNSYAPAPVIGRADGGLSQLLRGDGHGGFTAVPVAESGLLVPGDAKAVVSLDTDVDGRPDLVVTRNNQPSLFFRNQGK